MRTATYSLFTLLLAFICVSCLEKEFDVYERNTENDFTAFNLDKDNLFIDDVANLVIEAGNYSGIEVEMVSDTINTSLTIDKDVISLTMIDDLNYTISSPEVGEQLIKISATDANGTELTGYHRMSFYEHGTTDFATVEGVVLNNDYKRKLTALHGEPEKLETYEVTVTRTLVVQTDTTVTTFVENRELWHYFSKGFSFQVYPSKSNVLDPLQEEVIYGMTIYGDNMEFEIDGVIYNTEIYPYEINDFTKFNTAEGLLIDEVIEKEGAPDNEDPTNLYQYDNVFYSINQETRKVFEIRVSFGI